MPRGLIEGINRNNRVKKLNDSIMNSREDQNSDYEISTDPDEKYGREFEETAQEHEKVHRTHSAVPQKLKPVKIPAKEHPLNNSDGTPLELGITPRKILPKDHKVLEKLKRVSTVEIGQAPQLPTAIDPKGKNSTQRMTLHVERKVFEDIQYLKANGRIKSISSLVTTAVSEFIEKYHLME